MAWLLPPSPSFNGTAIEEKKIAASLNVAVKMLLLPYVNKEYINTFLSVKDYEKNSISYTVKNYGIGDRFRYIFL